MIIQYADLKLNVTDGFVFQLWILCDGAVDLEKQKNIGIRFFVFLTNEIIQVPTV